MMAVWPVAGFAARLSQADRLVILYGASWCPYTAAIIPDVEDAAPESALPFARADLTHPLDPRWDDHHIAVVPTLVYYEKGEELERIEAERSLGLTRPQLDRFIEHCESLQDEDRPKWFQRRKRQPTSRRP